MGKYFGTDGIRGIALEAINETIAFRVGQGLSKAFDIKQVVIGHDTRQSSPLIAYLIGYGALSQGLDVYFAGVCSTPMLAHYAKEVHMIGIMVTASHNSYTDNGIKVLNQGYKSTPEEEAIIEDVIDHPLTDLKPSGRFEITHDFSKSYERIYEAFPMFKSPLKIVYDSANGGNYVIAKQMFDRYTRTSVHLGNEPDGLNINVDCGSTHMNHIQAYVKNHQYDIGFSFDGDGDRLLVCDQNRIYSGDEIIYMIARFLRKHEQLKDNHVVLTKMSNPGLLKALREDNITYTLTDVGDKYVTDVLLKNDYAIGGENSGHIVINTLLHTGDGLLAAIYLLYVLTIENKKLEEAISDYVPYPYRLVNVENVDKSILKTEQTVRFLAHIKKDLGDDALLLVRASGTEPLVRITVSHKDQSVVDQTIDKIVKYIHIGSE